MRVLGKLLFVAVLIALLGAPSASGTTWVVQALLGDAGFNEVQAPLR